MTKYTRPLRCPHCHRPMACVTIWSPLQSIREHLCRNKECELYAFAGIAPTPVRSFGQMFMGMQ